MSLPEDFGKMWISYGWLEHYWFNARTVLNYFGESKGTFYDPSCNNEIVRQQQLDPRRAQTMEGIYYEGPSPDQGGNEDKPYYIIRKMRATKRRSGEFDREVLAMYYVIKEGNQKGQVFCLPDLHSVLNYKYTMAIDRVSKAFKTLHSKVRHNIGKMHDWDHGKFAKEPSKGASKGKRTATKSEKKTGDNQEENGMDVEESRSNNAVDEKKNSESENIKDVENEDESKEMSDRKPADRYTAGLVYECLDVTIRNRADQQRLNMLREAEQQQALAAQQAAAAAAAAGWRPQVG